MSTSDTQATKARRAEIARLEGIAKQIYEAMCWTVANPPFGGHTPDWQEGGNSFAQGRAREAARSIAAELSRLEAAVAAREGYVLVPVEPTKEMMRVAANKWKDWRITWDTGLTNLAAPMVSPLYLTYKQMIAARPTLSEVAQSPYAFLNEYGREIEISVKAGVHIEIIGPDSRITLDLTPKEASRLKAGLDEYLAARPTPVGSNALHDASCAAAAGPGSADCTCARPTPADSGEGR